MLYLSSVLWQPRRNFAKLPEINVSLLIVIFIGIEFVTTLPILGVIVDGVHRVAIANPALSPGSIPYIVAFSVLFTSTINVIIVGVTAVPLLLVTLIFGARSSYRAIASMLLLASSPILLGHALRNLSYCLGWKQDVTSGVLTLQQILPPFQAPLLQRLLHAFDVFDVWTFMLVLFGFMAVSDMKRLPSLATALVIWGMLQILLFRLYMGGPA